MSGGMCGAPDLTGSTVASKMRTILSSTTHSAAGQAAGYEYQRQLALVLLAEALREDPRVAVCLEAIEDVDVISDKDSVGRHVQAKHHLDDFTLTDRSVELWATLTVWMDLADAVGGSPLPRLQLATTSLAGSDSAAALLGPDGRNIEGALTKLLDAANELGATKTRPARRRFAALGKSTQLKLLHAMTVLDASPHVTDLDVRLRTALGMVVPREQPDAFIDRVKGWWVTRSVELLAGERSQITGQELYRFCDGVRDDFRSGHLRVTSELQEDPTLEAKQPLLRKTFVRQLKLVDAPDAAVDLAVRHYYRAYAQRGRWSREIDDLDDDVRGYEQTLTDEWDTAFVALQIRASPDPVIRSREGLEFASTFGENTRARLRGIDEHVLCRGTLHGLSDDLTIGWHPDFRDRADELVSQHE